MKYLRKFYFIIFIVLFLIIACANYQSYRRTESILRDNYKTEVKLIKNIVYNSLEDAFVAYYIYEIILNNEVEEKPKILLTELEEDKNPENWKLFKLQSKIPDYEIYLSDKNLKIINKTLAADLGMNFSKYREFSRLLYAKIDKQEFVADKLNLISNNDLITKYSYQPAPNSNYLLELSIDLSRNFPLLGEFNIFATAAELAGKYEQLQNINFYKINKKSNRVGLINSSRPGELRPISSSTETLVKKATSNNQPQSSTSEQENYQLLDIYLPFSIEGQKTDSEWLNSFVVRARYDNQILVEKIEAEQRFLFFNLSVILLIFILFSTIMSYFIKKIEAMAYHDHLTGLPNRKAFENYFKAENRKNFNQKIAILYLDLDGFKGINDNYGHDTGDMLLKTVAKRLKNSLRSQDKVSRMGGDEFTILLTDIENDEDVKNIISKIKEKIAEPYQINGKEIKISCSIGYSIDFRARQSFQDLINKADLAMYEVKNKKN